MPEIDWRIQPGQGLDLLRLGVARSEIVRRLTEAGFEVDDDEPQWLYVDDIDVELKFADSADPALEAICASDDQLRFGPVALIDEPIHKVIGLLRVVNEETAWTLRSDEFADAKSKASRDPAVPGSTPPTIKQLLLDGTLWLRPFGLGLDLVCGDITSVRIRRAGDVPSPSYGPLTDAQRKYIAHPDVSARVLESDADTRLRSGYFFTLCLLAATVAMGIVIWQGIDYQRRWNAAPTVPGEVIAVDPPPPEPFPERYTIAYHDTTGAPHEVVFQRNDVYVTPKVGEKIDIRYLPEAPADPMGPAKINDAAFTRFVPWGIGVMATYCIVQLIVPLVGLLMRRRKSND